MDAFMLIFADKPIFLTETEIQLMREQIYSNAQSDTTPAATPTQPHRLNYTRGRVGDTSAKMCENLVQYLLEMSIHTCIIHLG